MILLLLRHGQAQDRPPGPGGTDRDRELTALGESQARHIAGLLASEPELTPEVVCSSRAARAHQTALIVTQAVPGLSTPSQESGPTHRDELALDVHPDRVFELIEELRAAGKSRVLLVGHNPQLSEAVALLGRDAARSVLDSTVELAVAAEPRRPDAGLRTGELAVFEVRPRDGHAGTGRAAESGRALWDVAFVGLFRMPDEA